MADPKDYDACDKLAVAAAAAAQDIVKNHDGVVILVMVKRKNGEYCAEMRSRDVTMRESIQAVNSWVFRRASQAYGN